MSSSGCVTCEARKIKCDQTKGPNGCRRCAKAGLECGGYLATRTSRSARGIRNSNSQAKLTSTDTPPHSLSPPDLATNKSTEIINSGAILGGSGSGGNVFAAPDGWSDCPIGAPSLQELIDQRSYELATPTTEHGATPPLGRIPLISTGDNPLAQMPTPPNEGTPLPPLDGPITPVQPNSSDPTFNPPDELITAPWAPLSPGLLARMSSMGGEKMLGPWSQGKPVSSRPTYRDDESEREDPQNLQVELLNGLVLDRKVQSNMVSFLVHSFTSWMSRFLFEPTRVIPLFREFIVRGHSYGYEAHRRMILIANSVLNVSESTNYDLAPFRTLYNELIKGVVEARARSDLTRDIAIETMQSCHEVISIMCKVCSLASILNTMNLCAPVFRRACPEASNEFVNLPRILTSFDVHLKLYATMDVLLSAITHRPMYFRYDLEFPSPMIEQILNADDGPGLRWLAGVPDGLIVTIARMNTYLEDYGGQLDPESVQALEKEILACTTAFPSGTEADPALTLGRIVVQESWRLGLCGADSSDSRVVRAQKKFMRLLAGVKPRRNPDTFLVVPMMILGVASTSLADQSIILARLGGISECKRPETLGNDMIRMLTNLWA
ncbi:unnamed protein product [Rhizoctonia solani]|uniref:Zn(2)-C6 fungal-type domain-containing protein n=1 Tax=Rhizoctonia solani TaxID=456999 RepID=A0A8H3HU33_9AGAM|nr:unnamed protein product [Rhizoctonia solani]